ncbi:hypothetical protein AMTRI_Chr10g225430 [Amborella trichopoda]
MGYSDFPFVARKGRDGRRFPGHHELLLYLKDFADNFRVRELIRFNTRVDYVGMVDFAKFGKNCRWVVRSRGRKDAKVSEEVFDAMVVATGHYSQPTLPNITGIRKQIHSHIYRIPDPYLNQVVVLVGVSLSRQDICIELLNVAKEVHLSSKTLEITEGLSKVVSKNKNCQLHLQIESLHEDGRVVFVYGTWVIADSIIYCTGYSYLFPFLDTEGIVVVDDNRVGPLYEHTFPPSLAPSLTFVGIPRKAFEVHRFWGFLSLKAKQIWISQVLSGRRQLPSSENMMEAINQFYHSRDVASYCDWYADQCGYPHLEEWKKTFRDEWNNEDEHFLQLAYSSPHYTQHVIEDPQQEMH